MQTWKKLQKVTCIICDIQYEREKATREIALWQNHWHKHAWVTSFSGEYHHKQVCVVFRYLHMLIRWHCLHSAKIDRFSCPPGPQQQTCSSTFAAVVHAGSGQTNRLTSYCFTDHAPHSVGSANNSTKYWGRQLNWAGVNTDSSKSQQPGHWLTEDHTNGCHKYLSRKIRLRNCDGWQYQTDVWLI